ncbi:family 43 glycosylhydrolase [Agromyces atrinae]|uniref:immunoglobulin-like domain-containing protein n=1 Tax=Agromyces atrinae TaxID=592376 RepID=UPI001F573C37|nr:immunoglobulin-like domain-containing protein [Agromyces atrinae]MCI2957388.1 family 43 glycosylhydrolase [Agromyces atrinae]
MFSRTLAIGAALAVSVSLLSAPVPAVAEPTDGLVAWYELDETSGTVAADSSGHGRNAAIEGAATWNGGSGFTFGGGGASSGNAVKLPDNIIAGLSSVTVALDVWTDPALTGNHFVYNLGNLAVGSPASGSGYLFTTTTPYRATISGQWWNNEKVTTKGQNLQKGIWRHLTYTQTGTTGVLYEDGVEVGRNANVTVTPAQIGNGTTTRNYIGRSAYAADNSFRGVVRDFRIYDRALAADEVGALAIAAHQATVDADAAWTETALGDVSAVIANLTLPSSGPAKAAITWSSSNTAVIANNGTVTRPATTAVVDLAATITAGTTSTTRVISVTVPSVANPDQDAVDSAAASLVVHDVDDVRGDLVLPTTATGDVAIAWSSSEPAVISTDGRVSRPAHGEPAATLELTATLTRGEASTVKTFPATVPALPEAVDPEAYLFTYFTDNTIEGEKIYFGASNGNDARNWITLNGAAPVLSSDQGTTGLRDPFIIRSPEGDTFYLIATDLSIGGGTSWDASQRSGSRYIEVWESHDLVNWSEQRHVQVSPENAGNTWAPEAYYDESLGEYVVFWASKLYADNDPNHTGGTHNRMLYATTRDFRTFSDVEVWQDTGVSRIDSTVLKVGDTYHRFTKDEAQQTGCLDIFEETSTDLTAPTTETSESGAWALQETCIGRGAATAAVEGPTIFAANPGDVNGEGYYLFVDEFGGRKYIPLFSEELGENADWSVPSGYSLPSPAPRHGTILPITAEEQARLFDAYLPAAQSAAPVSVRTALGTPAELPARVAVSFADGSTQDLAVTWDAPSPADYFEREGTIQVSGTVTGFGIAATATIEVVDASGPLQLHYDFSQVTGTTVPDSSPYGNDGVLRGTGASVTGDVLNLPGGAANSSAAYVQLPTGMFDGENTLTISAWLKNDTTPGNYAALFFGSASNPPAQYWLLNPRTGSNRFKSVITNSLNAGAPWGTEAGITPTTASNGIAGPITSSAWGLYTTVIEPGSITGYFNGEKIGTVATTRTVSDFGRNLVGYIGRSSYSDIFYKGGIRDLKVYTSALTDSDVAGEYFAGVDDPAAVDAALAADAAALDLGPSTIVADIDLPARGAKGSAITWSSSDPAHLAADGSVTRPTDADASVTLTATLTIGERSTTRDFVFTVLADDPQKDLDFVADGFDLAITHLSSDIVLPTSIDGVDVSWQSSDPQVIAADGSVLRAPDQRAVTLTATFSRGGLTATREYAVTVLAVDTGRLGTYIASGNTTRTDVLHLATSSSTSADDASYAALNNGRGVLYPTLGSQKLGSPEVFRTPGGAFGLVATDDSAGNRIHVFDSTDLVQYTNPRLVAFAPSGVDAARVSVRYDNGRAAYVLSYVNRADSNAYTVETSDFVSFSSPERAASVTAPAAGSFPSGAIETASIALTAAELDRVESKLSRVVNTGVDAFADIEIAAGESFELPGSAVGRYSSGSTSNLPVEWSADDVANVDTATPGTYTVDGTVSAKTYSDPLVERRADPDVTLGDDGWYYFTGSYPMTRADDPDGYDRVILRRAETIEGLKTAEEVTIWHENTSSELNRFIWAPELTKIGDDWYVLFTAARGGGVWDIRPAILKFTGDEFGGEAAMDPANWTSLGQMLAAPGDTEAFTHFSLDMTYFEAGGKHYVVWAEKPAGGSTLRMAEIDPANPRQLTTPSILLSAPEFAWEKGNGDAIDEGPAVIVNNGRILLAFSASTVDDKYCVGLLYADEGADLMDPSAWTKVGYPLLTSADVPGQVGPGHNSFTVDELGNPVIVYHSRTVNDSSLPGEATDAGLSDPRRHARAATVHWDVDGMPVFTLTEAEQLDPANADTQVRVVVTGDDVDPVDPVVSAIVTPASPDGDEGWYRQAVTVELAVTEGATADIEYRVDAGEWVTYSAPVTVTADGSHVVEARAVVANEPVADSDARVEFAIDATAPVATATVTPESGAVDLGETASVTFTGRDTGSGVRVVEYRVDGGAWVAAEGELAITELGSHLVEYRATDRAGNVSAVSSTTVVVRDVERVAEIDLASPTVRAGESVSFTASGFDAGERVDVTLYSDPILLGSVTADADGRIDASFLVPADVPPGEHTLRVAGAESGATGEAALTVLAAAVPGGPGTPGGPGAPGTPGGIALTGVELLPGIALALMLLVSGGLLWFGRRRSRLS